MENAKLQITIDNTGDVYLDVRIEKTGEIRRKTRSMEWLAKRLFQDELRTWEKVHKDEPIRFMDVELRDWRKK